jgi:hypothetical protein
MSSDPGQQPVMSGRQSLVFRSLADRSEDVAVLYREGLVALQQGASADRFYAAGHAIRLFMHDLPTMFDLPTLGSLPQLSNKVRDLDQVWKTACQSSCRIDGGWRGEIDALLARLLSVLEEFFSWREDQIAEDVFRRSDPGPAALPSDLFERRAKRWLKLFGYFNSVAHLSSTTLIEFHERLTEVEEIVLSCLYRQPSETFATIDAILAEGETDA